MDRKAVKSSIEFNECVDYKGKPKTITSHLLMKTVASIRGVMTGAHADNAGECCEINLRSHPNCDVCNVVEQVIGALTNGEKPLIHLVN